MATYLSVSEFKSLALPPRAFRDVDDADLEVKLQHYCDIVDSYLARRYVLPLTAFGGGVKQAVLNIGAYEIVKWRGVNTTDGANADIRANYEKTISDLEAIASYRDPLTFGDIQATERPRDFAISNPQQPPATYYATSGDCEFDTQALYWGCS